MTRQSPVDRESEFALFDSMLAGKTEERILFVEAPSGMGKTILLDGFGRRKPKKILFAKIDFRSGSTSIAEFFSRLRDKLGGPKKFSNLGKQLNQILHPSVSISKNLMIGKNQIEAYLSGRDEQEREIRLSALTDAIFEDIRSLGTLLLIFDTYEKSDDSIKKWISDSFLPRVQNSPNVFVVIGGQSVPEDNLEWEHQPIKLTGITHEYWHRYAESKGVTIHTEYIRGCCDICEGHPLKMKSYIDGFLVQGH